MHDKRVIITGGTGGLGSAVVKAFADAGAMCEVTTRRPGTSSTDRVRYHVVGVTDEDAVARFFAQFDDLWASVHLVGAFDIGPIADTSLAKFRAMFDANAVSCFLCCREAVKAMRKIDAGGGRIVNVSSRPAVVPAGGMIAYTTSKAAVSSITQCLAEEVKGDGILVNAVVPSIMDTPANRAAMPKADFSKWPKVEEVAQAILFLASGENALTSGALVPVYAAHDPAPRESPAPSGGRHSLFPENMTRAHLAPSEHLSSRGTPQGSRMPANAEIPGRTSECSE